MISRIIITVFCLATYDVLIADEGNSEHIRSPGCESFPDKLDSCEPLICEFKHPINGVMLEREIIGMEDGKCLIQEESSKESKIECRYSDSYRKAIAQYWRNNNTKSMMVDTSASDIDTIYIIDGKEVTNPLMEQNMSGVCRLRHNTDLAKKNDTNLEITWSKFNSVKDSWIMDIEFTNNQNKMVILDIAGTGKVRNWRWSGQVKLDSWRSRTLHFEIGKYFYEEIAYDVKKIVVLAYECGKLSKSDEELLCSSEFGFNGILPPWKILENRELAGSPVIPTLTITKYFLNNSLEIPPVEVTESEFL